MASDEHVRGTKGIRRQGWDGPRRRAAGQAGGHILVRRLRSLLGHDGHGAGALFGRTGEMAPRHGWRQRHSGILVFVWSLLLLTSGLAFYAADHPMFGAYWPVHEQGLAYVAPWLAASALAAGIGTTAAATRRARTYAAAVAIALVSVAVIYLAGGGIAPHLVAFIGIAVISLYHESLPVVLGLVLVAVHHVTAVVVAPDALYAGAALTADPVMTLGVHLALMVGLALVQIYHWRTAAQLRLHADHVVGAASEGIIGLDETGHVTFMNTAAERLLGRKERHLGQPASRVFSNRIPGLLASDGTLLSLEDAETRHGRGLRFADAEKEMRFIDWSAIPLMVRDQGVGAVVTMRDVTERHWAESRLREKELKLSAAQRVAHVGSFEWAPVADVVRVSDEFRRILRDSGVGPVSIECIADLLDAVNDEDRPAAEAAFASLARGDTEVALDCRIGSGRRTRHCSLRARLEMRAIGNDPVRMVRGSFHDVTDRVRAEEMRRHAEAQDREIRFLREQDTFKNRFINAIAHELNTPLTPLRLQLHLLKRDPEERLSEKQRRAVQMLDRNIQRFGSLVEDLLDAARVQGGKLRIQHSTFRMDELIEEVVEHFEGVMLERELALEMADMREVVVTADRDRLSQVVYNLLSNACKFTPTGGTVEVGIQATRDDVIVAVRDDGIGLSEDDQKRLFQPFTQVHDHMERTESGTGLGLFLCRGLVALHNGEIWCESDGPGKGATFRFRVPLEPNQDDTTSGFSPALADAAPLSSADRVRRPPAKEPVTAVLVDP